MVAKVQLVNSRTLLSRCEGAYSEATLRAYRSDLATFEDWCTRRKEPWLPARADAVARFVDEEALSKSLATIKRRVCAIQFAHRLADLPSPIDRSEVYLALRRASRAKRRRPHQALGLTADLLSSLLKECSDTLHGVRDGALFSLEYDTLCRSSEIIAMRVEHVASDFGSIFVPRTKSDPFGDGRLAYLSPRSQMRLKSWLRAAELVDGPIFQGIRGGRLTGAPLATSSVRRRIKAAAKRADLDEDIVLGLSGHYMRVGAAQDMMVAGCDTLGIMQAGGWRTPAVAARYVKNAVAQQVHLRRWKKIAHLLHLKPGSLAHPRRSCEEKAVAHF